MHTQSDTRSLLTKNGSALSVPGTTNYWEAFHKYPGFKEFNLGVRPAFIILPEKKVDTPNNNQWIWYAPTFYRVAPNAANDWMFGRLLEHGFAIVGVDVGESFGNPEGRAIYQDFFAFVTRQFGLAPKASLLPQSRGGLMLYNWAAEHPESVRCIAGIYPVGDIASYPTIAGASRAYGMSEQALAVQLAQHNPIDRLAPLARAGVPILHIHGDNDRPVPLERNSAELIGRYKELGGRARLIVPHGHGHEVTPAFFENRALLDFIIDPKTIDSSNHSD